MGVRLFSLRLSRFEFLKLRVRSLICMANSFLSRLAPLIVCLRPRHVLANVSVCSSRFSLQSSDFVQDPKVRSWIGLRLHRGLPQLSILACCAHTRLSMKRFIRDASTGKFLTSSGAWSEDTSSALDLPDFSTACQRQRQLHLQNAEYVMLMGATTSRYDVAYLFRDQDNLHGRPAR
jgi:hypothetical protein